jgi:hypothetical protein
MNYNLLTFFQSIHTGIFIVLLIKTNQCAPFAIQMFLIRYKCSYLQRKISTELRSLTVKVRADARNAMIASINLKRFHDVHCNHSF